MNSEHELRDGNDIAADYDERICLGLVRFGYLTARMIGGLIRDGSPGALRAAQRRLKSLVRRKLVLTERLSNGIPVYKLSAKGAAFLRELGHDDIPKRGTRDARTGNAYHRALTNNFLIFSSVKPEDYWPEYSILKGRAPIKTLVFKKQRFQPDAIVNLHGESGCFWIEAENAPKRPARIEKLILFGDYMFADWNGHILDTQYGEISFRNMLFICPAPAQARAVARAYARVIKKLTPYGETKNRIHVVHAPMPSSLIWPEHRIQTAHDFAVELGYIEDEEPSAE